MAGDKRTYELVDEVTTEDTNIYFNIDKSGFSDAKKYKLSVLKGHLKVGDQQYTSENYVTDDESLTESIDQLDMALKAVSDASGASTSLRTVKLTLTTAQVNTLGTAFELFSGAGTDSSYQLIDLKWAIYPSTQLDVGTQNLEIYFEDMTKYLALIRNVNLESASRLVKGVQIQDEHEIGINKKVYCKLSGSANPTSGAASMDFWFVYQEITVQSST